GRLREAEARRHPGRYRVVRLPDRTLRGAEWHHLDGRRRPRANQAGEVSTNVGLLHRSHYCSEGAPWKEVLLHKLRHVHGPNSSKGLCRSDRGTPPGVAGAEEGAVDLTCRRVG